MHRPHPAIVLVFAVIGIGIIPGLASSEMEHRHEQTELVAALLDLHGAQASIGRPAMNGFVLSLIRQADPNASRQMKAADLAMLATKVPAKNVTNLVAIGTIGTAGSSSIVNLTSDNTALWQDMASDGYILAKDIPAAAGSSARRS